MSGELGEEGEGPHCLETASLLPSGNLHLSSSLACRSRHNIQWALVGVFQLGQVSRVPGEVPGGNPGSHERPGAGGAGVVSLGLGG